MPDLIVNNPNILVDAPKLQGARRPRRIAGMQTERETETLRQVRRLRHEIDQLACSATWAEDCLYRGADYPPDFKCNCPVCRELFPHRLHPRPIRQSRYSLDCQVEATEDPEFADDFRRLRNDRPRYGSVFLARSLGQVVA